MLRTFAACLTLLIWHARFKNLPTIVVDEEYPGNDPIIRQMVSSMWATLAKTKPLLEFRRVGKSSPAHHLAYETAAGKLPTNRKLTYGEVRRLAIKSKSLNA